MKVKTKATKVETRTFQTSYVYVKKKTQALSYVLFVFIHCLQIKSVRSGAKTAKVLCQFFKLYEGI